MMFDKVLLTLLGIFVFLAIIATSLLIFLVVEMLIEDFRDLKKNKPKR